MSEIAEMALMLAAEAMSKSEGGGDAYTKDEIDGFLSDKVDKEAGKSLSTNDFTDEFKDKLTSITNPMILKGRVDTFEELANISSPQAGWIYFVGGEAAIEFEEYVFTESGTWEFIGFNNIDLSNYVQKDELQTALGSKANSSDVYDKATSDSRFLGINGTAVKAVADGTGANIAERFTGLQEQIDNNKSNILALNTAIYLYNVTIEGEIVEFTEGYVMRIGNQVHINCKLIFLKDYNHKYWNLFHLPFAVKTPDEVRYRIDCIQEDSTTKWIYVDNKGSAFACGDVMFVKGDTIEVKNLILDMYVE